MFDEIDWVEISIGVFIAVQIAFFLHLLISG